MSKHVLLISYLAAWALLTGCLIFAAIHAGWQLWPVVLGLQLLFFLVNGALAYTAVLRNCKVDQRQPPSYVSFLFHGWRAPKLNEVAPPYLHVFVGTMTAVFGSFLVFCGVALANGADWSNIPDRLVVAAICLVPVLIGATCLWVAWRVFVSRRHTSNVA